MSTKKKTPLRGRAPRAPMMLPEDRLLMPFADSEAFFYAQEAYYTIQQTADQIAGDVDWECRYVPARDGLLVRGRRAAKMLRVIAQRMRLLPVGETRTELATIDGASQQWGNYRNSHGEMVSWLPVPPGLRPAMRAVAARLNLSWPAGWDGKFFGGLSESVIQSSTPLLSTIRESCVGLFRYSGRLRDLAASVDAVRTEWPPPIRVIVLTPSSQQRKAIVNKFAEQRAETPETEVGGMFVTTPNRLHQVLSVDKSGEANYEFGRTIVLVTDAAMVGTYAAANELGRLPNLRCYGFLSREARSEPYVQRRIDAFFGLRTVDLHQTADGKSPTKVIRHENTHHVWLPPNATALTVKQRCIWTNKRRNRLVRLVANFFAAEKALPAQSFAADLRLARKLLPRNPSVLILVEAEPHLTELCRILGPMWVPATFGVGGRLTATTQTASQAKVIATFSAAAKLPAFDVVIRADGGPGLPSEAIVTTDGLPRILIDVWDRGRPPLRTWARSRWEAYQQRGWIPRPDRTEDLVQELIVATLED